MQQKTEAGSNTNIDDNGKDTIYIGGNDDCIYIMRAY